MIKNKNTMKWVKKLIFGNLLILSIFLLSACSHSNLHGSAIERIQAAQEVKKTVTLQLLKLSKNSNDDEVVLRLSLLNPSNLPIQSVQSWLSYNPKLLKGISIDTQASDFDLMAPYNNNFDSYMGLVMLGRSTTKVIDKEEITVVDIHFKKLSDAFAMIDTYDYKDDLKGHVSVNILKDNHPINVLIKPLSPLFILK